MRVLQLIDSLRPGGAERMSISYANALAGRIEGSYLCCTRMEGLLKGQLAPEVGYLFLSKKSTIDINALRELRKFVKKNHINLVQAHGSSFFLAVLLKIFIPELKVVWHDHLGERAGRNLGPGILLYFSHYFAGIITVNKELKRWAIKNLKCKKVKFIPNFPLNNSHPKATKNLEVSSGFRIIHLANLKGPKDHMTLLKAFRKLSQLHSLVSLHLVGKEEENDYSKQLRFFLQENKLEDKVFFYGEQEETYSLLKQADLGVLSSISEGLPVALLEYGLAGLPVVCTRVGECEAVIGGAGQLVSAGNSEAMFEALKYYVENEVERKKDSVVFHNRILKFYSEKRAMEQLLDFYQEIAH